MKSYSADKKKKKLGLVALGVQLSKINSVRHLITL